MNIPILTKLQEARVDLDGCLVEGIILASGLSENGTYYPPEVVEASHEVFRGVQCYADHPRDGESERSVRDVVGVIERTWPDNGRLRAAIRLSRAHDWLLTMIGENLVGDLSINALGRTRVARRDGKVVREVQEITKAHSVDFVARAAAGGHVERILHESAGYAEGLRLIESISTKELSEARPDLVETLRQQMREELLSESGEGLNEVRVLEEEIDKRRVALQREATAARLIDRCGLPSSAKEFLLQEAVALRVESEDSYEGAVKGLIERHRKMLAELSSRGMVRGMGSGKEDLSDRDAEKRRTLRLMGVG